MAYKISTTIEIAAPPDVVRSKFLDFSTLHLYQRPTGFIRSITLPDGKAGMDLVPGDEMKNDLGGMKVNPIVAENNEATFSWQGAWPFSWFCLLEGTHTFQFIAAIESTPSSPKTHFVQEEGFRGPLAWLMGLQFTRNPARDGFIAFNEDLKKWVEDTS